MTRTLIHSSDRRLLWTALVVLPLALAACGNENQKPIAVRNSPEGALKVTPAGGLPPRSEPAVTTPTGAIVTTFDGAESLYNSGKYGEAKEAFQQYVSANPERAIGQYMLGLSAWKSGDRHRADLAFDRAIALDPKHVKSYLNSARVLLDLNRDQEAVERVQVALAIDSTSQDGLRVLARAQSKLDLTDDALETYRRAIVLDDRDPWTLNNLGALYLELGEREDALAVLARTVEIRGTSPVFQNNFGMALEQTGHLTAAKQAYEAAVRADSTYKKAVANLSRLGAVVIDPSKDELVDLHSLADLFRVQVGMWRDAVLQSMERPEN